MSVGILVDCKYIGRTFRADCCDYPDKCDKCRHNTYGDDLYFPFKSKEKSFFEKRSGL